MSIPHLKLEATTGFEPVNRDFADPRLNHLATSPRQSKLVLPRSFSNSMVKREIMQ